MDTNQKEYITGAFQSQKKFFATRKTQPVDFRIQQLANLKKSFMAYNDAICDAMFTDLGKSKSETEYAEIKLVLDELDYCLDNLKPGAATVKALNAVWEEKIDWKDWQVLAAKHEYNLGFPGIALSSFLHFSYQYYDYHRSDTNTSKTLNRHAIIHGADNQFGTKVNNIKLFTYLYLMLEPVLKIIFSER